MTKYITLRLTEDQLNLLIVALENDFEDTYGEYGELQDGSAVYKGSLKRNAFRQRTLDTLAQAKT